MKKCSKCKLEKENMYFSNSQFHKSGGICRPCNTAIMKQYRENNSEKIKQYQKQYDFKYYKENKDKILINKKFYYKNNKTTILEIRKQHYNKNNKRKYNQQYYKDHKRNIINQQNQYSKLRRANDLKFRLKTCIFSSINFYLKRNGFIKNKSTLGYLPYSIDQLRMHLENQFESWMNWNNHGRYSSKLWNDNDQSTWTWQIDHIIPHSTFKYTSMEDEDFKKCWALNNLRPLSAKQNFLDGISRIRH